MSGKKVVRRKKEEVERLQQEREEDRQKRDKERAEKDGEWERHWDKNDEDDPMKVKKLGGGRRPRPFKSNKDD